MHGKNWKQIDRGVFTRAVKNKEHIYDLDLMIQFQSIWDKLNGRQFEVVSITAVYNENLKVPFPEIDLHWIVPYFFTLDCFPNPSR